jgi:DNA-binding PadR family transcriptional regulator
MSMAAAIPGRGARCHGGHGGGRLRSGRALRMAMAGWMIMAARRRAGRGPFGRGFPFGGPGMGGPGAGGAPFGPPGFGGPFRRGPRVRRGDVRAAALALLSEGPQNGYQIIQQIAERSGGVWRPSPGSVYPALQQLEDEGLIRSVERDGRRSFELTDAGRQHVEAHRDELAAPWETVAGTVTEELLELRELSMQLSMALMQVAQAGNEAQVAEARRILVDARRALYRILASGDPDEAE